MQDLPRNRTGDAPPQHGPTGRDAAPAGDRGSTLVELLIAIVLLGVVVTSMLAALRTSVLASSLVFDAARVETVLLNAGDRIARAPQQCEYEAYVDAAAVVEGWPLDSTSVVVERLVGDGTNPADWQPQPCPDDVAAFDVQRLTITAAHPDGRITRTLTVVKSDVD